MVQLIHRRVTPVLVAAVAMLAGLACGADDALTSDAEDLEMSAQPLLSTLGTALPLLSKAQRAQFQDGLTEFNGVEGVLDGLGPVYNERGCGVCHSVGAIGGAGTQFEVHAAKHTVQGLDDMVDRGGGLFDRFSVTALAPAERAAIADCRLPATGEPVPADADVTALRRTTAVFGLGLVDATPDTTFTRLAAAQPTSIRGRAPLVDNIAAGRQTVGKFGWKSQNPSLFQFAGDAYMNEMGITNPLFPDEQAPMGDPSLAAGCDLNTDDVEDDGEGLLLFTDYMRYLAPPPRAVGSVLALSGDALFTSVGCDGCHTRSLTSGKSEVAALSGKVYHPYSDFLVHDMGSLADGIEQGGASAREMRTAPLWGLRFVDPTDLLHDGRATSLSDAIVQHDGQAAASRKKYQALTATKQKALLAFLQTL